MLTDHFRPSKRAVRHATRAPWIRACWGLCALLLSLTTAVGQGDNSPVTLRMKFKQGDVTRYQMTMLTTSTTTMASMKQAKPMSIPVNINMVTEQKVTQALPNGGAEVTQTVLSMKMMINGKPGPNQNTPPPTTVTYDARGNIVSMKGMPAGARGMMGVGPGGGIPTVMPANAVKPGDSWSVPINMGMGSGTAHLTFVKVETVGRYRTARIHATATLPMHMMIGQNGQPTKQAANAMMTMAGTVNVTMDTNFAIVEGKIVRENGTVNTAMTTTPKQASNGQPAGMPGPIKTNTKMNINMMIMS